MKRLRYLSSLMFGTVMLLAGLLVWFGFRNQDVHATPPAILLACIASAIVSALLGWFLAPIYVRWRKVTAIFFVPFTILVSAAIAAGTLYVLASAAMRGTAFFLFVSAQTHSIPDYALVYIGAGSLVWVPGFIAATFVLTRASARTLRFN